ncbi:MULTISPECIES: NlpC/P60 family protein [unclassified Arthrobacter]|uniref:NlpC/P60 family protein n=1 Tax=unclassified Arthrobacter TaxID=235627 RepID=UPI00209751F3|nr:MULTISPECIES: NlpC/P60 family protein [unclassified Arthrobacter]MDD1478584.1 NlpC/P60 family protein [Arthrobacter sp. H16F315]MDN4643949.1 NlpC/P60 family protein [Arthrobacter sp. PsM3]
MSARKNPGRHRAVTVQTSTLATISRTVADNAGGVGRQAAVIAAASGLVLTSGIAAQAADAPAQRESAPASNLEVSGQTQAQLTADSSVRISFERPAVATTPAPVIEAPKPAVTAPAPAAVATRPAPAVQAQPRIAVQSQAATPPAAASAAGGVNAAMVSAAYAQLGMIQDCTRLVEKALGSAGIPVGDLAPMQFMSYGKVVGDAQPGDMVIQPGHIGIYVGNGQVLSSGMNGKNQTVVHPLSWLTATGPVTFVRAGA